MLKSLSIGLLRLSKLLSRNPLFLAIRNFGVVILPGQNIAHLFGKIGEELATNILKTKGYHILERNWKCKLGEVDIIAVRLKEIVFVEVKTRRSEISKSFLPLHAVDQDKQQRLRKIASFYQRTNLLRLKRMRLHTVSFDIVSVEIVLFYPFFWAKVLHYPRAY